MSRMMTVKTRLLALPLLGAFVLAGPGPAWALSVEEIANYTKPDRQKVLEEIAKKEGEVLWIGGINEKTASGPIVKAFNEKYPFVTAKYLRTGSAQALQRILAEHRARKANIDLFNGNAVVELKEANLVQDFRTPALDIYPEDFKDPQRMYATLRFAYQGVALWNTNQIAAKDAPKSYEDLLHPRFKGKMVASDSATGGGLPFLITYFRNVWGEPKTLDYLQKLAKQEVKTSSSSTRNLADLVVAGEYPMLINPAGQHIGQARSKGAPVEGVMQEPVLTRNDYVLLLKSAPHPAASMLLIDFMLDRPAQEILLKAEYSPAHPDLEEDPAMRKYTPKGNGYKQFTVDDQILADMSGESVEIFRRLFQ